MELQLVTRQRQTSAVELQESKIQATFHLGAYVRRQPIGYGWVKIAVPWHELTDMYINLCAPREVFTAE